VLVLLVLLLLFESLIVRREALAPVHHRVGHGADKEGGRLSCRSKMERLHVHAVVRESALAAQCKVMKRAKSTRRS
jgi:hypothetical protein